MDSSRSSTSDATKVDYGVLSVSIPKDHSMELSDTDFTTSPASEASQQYSHASRVKRTASYTDFHRLSQQSLKQQQQQQQQQSRGHQRRKSNSGGAVVSVHEATMNGGALSSLEGYTLISRIGEGAFSTVYQARNEITGEHVAIKAISKSGMTAVQTANVRKEVAIMESLQHPRIIKLLEYREARDYHYLIMELAPGGEMFERVLELTYLSERLARHVIIQVAEAVKHMHANGIVQRDLKLENVVFEPMPIFP
ncbi:MAPK-activated protein kinase Srk1, partial [Linderina pennispora]